MSGNKPVIGDFDGNGKQDAAIFRPSNGFRYCLRSMDNQFYAIQFGAATDKLVAADNDIDDRTDVAVFRPSSGIRYLNRSAAGFVGISFGAATDKPIPNAFVQ